MEWSKILVPVNGDKIDEDVIKLACDLAKKSKGKVHVIHVIQVKRSLPLDAELGPEIQRGEEILNHAEDIARAEGYKVETDLVQARETGPAIVDEAAELEADLIIIGMDYKKRFGEFSLGDIVPYVLKNAAPPVLLLREPISPK